MVAGMQPPRLSRSRSFRGSRGLPRLALAALAAAAGLVGSLSEGSAFVSAALRPASRSADVSRQAKSESFTYSKPKGPATGFNDADAAKPIKKKKAAPKAKKAAKGGDEETSTKLAKDSRAGKSGALSTTKLKDLRDKTLALRQKREAELDEYEEGRALIAKYGPEVGMMPKKVAKRAAKRGVVIGGSFYATMLAVFGAGLAIYKTQDLIIPPSLMAFVTLILLALAIFGGSYGLMSASWDEDKEGSVLGVEEFGDNVKAIGEGFRKMSMQNEYEKAIEQRRERKGLLAATKEKKKELLNK